MSLLDGWRRGNRRAKQAERRRWLSSELILAACWKVDASRGDEPLSVQLVQQLRRFYEIGSVEPLSEPGVKRLEQCDGRGSFALFM